MVSSGFVLGMRCAVCMPAKKMKKCMANVIQRDGSVKYLKRMVPQLMASSRRKAVGRTRMVRREHRQDVAILLPIPFRALLCWMELPMR